MQEIKLPKHNTIIKLRCEFIDLLGYLEKIDIDYLYVNQFNGFIYMDTKNEFRYSISHVVNNMETYSFYYKCHMGKDQGTLFQGTFECIPNAIFQPNILYDFDIDLEKKTFKKLDEYKPIEPDHIVINIKEDIIKSKPMSLFRRLLGC
jgi:hypothetical protein